MGPEAASEGSSRTSEPTLTDRMNNAMIQTTTASPTESVVGGITEHLERGLIVLTRADGFVRRRILYVNNYGGRAVWERIKMGLVATHHIWGCLELVRLGYQVALAEPVPDFLPRR